MTSFPNYRQLDQMDCGPTCLRIIAQNYGRYISAQYLRKSSKISRSGMSLYSLAELSEELGFRATAVKLSLQQLVEEVPLPCVLHWEQRHYVVLYKIKKDSFASKLSYLELWRRNPSPSECTISTEIKSNCSFYNYKFQISDPKTGLVTVDYAELVEGWLSSAQIGSQPGIALLLEPTTTFFEANNEKVSKGNSRQILSYLWQYRGLVLQIILGLLAGSILSGTLPFLAQSVVDIGIDTANLSFVYLVLFAQIALLVSISSVNFIRDWILYHISTRLNLALVSDFLMKLLKLPIAFFDTRMLGDVMQRIGDHQRVESFLTGHALNSLFSVINLVVFCIILSFYQSTYFLLAFSSIIIYGVWAVSFLKFRRTIDQKRFEISAQGQSQLIEMVQGIQDVKLAGAEQIRRWGWERIQTSQFALSKRSLTISQIQHAGAVIINSGKNILITFLTVKAVIEGQLSIGAMVSVQFILGQISAPIEQLTAFLKSWQDARISIERLNEMHELENEEPFECSLTSSWDPSSSIVLENVDFCYPGSDDHLVLKNINIVIPCGKTTAIVGTSGSGKTTLLKLLIKIYAPTKGKIMLQSAAGDTLSKYSGTNDGIDLQTVSHSAWRRQCGVVTQDGYIFSDTIAQNIALSDEFIDQAALESAIQTSDIREFINSLPLGQYTKIGAEGNGISQGQKQRILIARAVYKNPNMILFDEATNALDAETENTVVTNLARYAEKRTVVIVAHRLSTVKNADQIIVLDNGSVAEMGTHDELISSRGRYFSLVSNQLELATAGNSC